MKKIFYIVLKYIIYLAVFLYILLNPAARKLFSGQVRLHELKADFYNACKTNEEFKKRLYYLETKPEYMERIVKDELEVLAEDEIEYRFEKK